MSRLVDVAGPQSGWLLGSAFCRGCWLLVGMARFTRQLAAGPHNYLIMLAHYPGIGGYRAGVPSVCLLVGGASS